MGKDKKLFCSFVCVSGNVINGNKTQGGGEKMENSIYIS